MGKEESRSSNLRSTVTSGYGTDECDFIEDWLYDAAIGHFSDHFFITIYKNVFLIVYSQSQTRDDIFQLIALNDITVS